MEFLSIPNHCAPAEIHTIDRLRPCQIIAIVRMYVRHRAEPKVGHTSITKCRRWGWAPNTLTP